MELRDFERLLKETFVRAKLSKDSAMKARVFESARTAFLARKKEFTVPFWKRVFVPRISSLAFATVSLFILFNVFPTSEETELSAGELLPKSGVVEIVREGATIMVTDATPLQKGDLVRVGNKGEAQIVTKDSLSSTIGEKSEVKVLDKNALFLHVGNIKGVSLNQGEVSTTRGVVKAFPGSDFKVSVSQTGETKVISERNDLSVTDWKARKLTLKEGEEVRISTDTVLPDDAVESKDKKTLASFQIKSIESKMVITRSKLLTVLEKSLDDKKGSATADLDSAQKSFKSIVESFCEGDKVELVRKNIETVEIQDIAVMLEDRNAPSRILYQAKALESFLVLLERNLNQVSFGLEKTGVKSFDWFVLVDCIFAVGNDDEKVYGEEMKDQYVESFVKIAQNFGTPAEQFGYRDWEFAKIPDTELGIDFKNRVNQILK